MDTPEPESKSCESADPEIPQLPLPVDRPFRSFDISTSGWWLILSDFHIPFHDPKAIELAVKEGARHKLKGILLNGDVLDSHEISPFDKDPTLPRYREELDSAKKFFQWLRYKFPRQKIIFKYGNHEERLDKYLMRRAPALFGIDEVQLHSMLNLKKYRVEWIGDKRVIRMNKLSVIHGHEYQPSIQVPVNPARGLFLRSKGSALCGHWHQTSEHNESTITHKPIGCWSTGCLCDLFPAYSPLNRWNSGFAMIYLANNGEFEVRNLRIINSKVI